MTLRTIDLRRLLFQLLRPNYALTNGRTNAEGQYVAPKLNNLYKFIFCLLYPLTPSLERWDLIRRRAYAIAACQYGQRQVLAILNSYYGKYGQITASTAGSSTFYLYNEGEAPDETVYLYNEGEEAEPVYLYNEGSLTTNADVIYIPKALADSPDYDDFVADVNAMLLYGITITIKSI